MNHDLAARFAPSLNRASPRRYLCGFGLIVFAGLMSSGCSSKGSKALQHSVVSFTTISLPRGDKTDVTFGDGVDVPESRAIAEYYFYRVYGNCGYTTGPQDRGDEWYFFCTVGIGGSTKPGIHIAKTGCQITCQKGPTITDPAQLSDPRNQIWNIDRSNRAESASNGSVQP